jgi:cytochrome c-type biogenesis protein CcmE
MIRRIYRRPALVLGSVIVLGGFGYLLYGGIGDSLVYYYSPTELRARGDNAFDTPVRLGGFVVPGSVMWNAESLDLRFRLGDDHGDLVVHSKGAPPQMFRDSIDVIVEGRLARDGVFHSHNLMVRHSNEYRPPPEGHEAANVYQPLIR